MVPRRLLACLVFALPLLVVVFAVVAGGHLLLASSQDQAAAAVLRGIGLGLLLAIVANVLLLVGCLGWQAYLVAPGRTPLEAPSANGATHGPDAFSANPEMPAPPLADTETPHT